MSDVLADQLTALLARLPTDAGESDVDSINQHEHHSTDSSTNSSFLKLDNSRYLHHHSLLHLKVKPGDVSLGERSFASIISARSQSSHNADSSGAGGAQHHHDLDLAGRGSTQSGVHGNAGMLNHDGPVRPLEIARLQVLYNSQLRRVRDLEHELELNKSDAIRREAGLKAELQNARIDTEDMLTDLRRTSTELQTSNVKVGKLSHDLSTARQGVHELGHQTALAAAELAAANTLIADLHMQIKEQQQAMSAGTVMGGGSVLAAQHQYQHQRQHHPLVRIENTNRNITDKTNNDAASIMDPIERMIKHQHQSDAAVMEEQQEQGHADADADAYARSVGGRSNVGGVDGTETKKNSNGGKRFNTTTTTADMHVAPSATGLLDLDLVTALELDTSDDELAMPMEHPGVVTPTAAALYEARQRTAALCCQSDEQAQMIVRLQHELDGVLAAAAESAEHHTLLLNSVTSKLALAEQQQDLAEADSLALHTVAEAKLKAELFRLQEELTAVKQQFIEICGEKQAVERHATELGSQCADLKTENTTIEKEVVTLTTQLNELQADVNVQAGTVVQQIAALSEQRAAVELELEQLKAANGMLKTSLAAATVTADTATAANADVASKSAPPSEVATQESQTDPVAGTVVQQTQTVEREVQAKADVEATTQTAKQEEAEATTQTAATTTAAAAAAAATTQTATVVMTSTSSGTVTASTAVAFVQTDVEEVEEVAAAETAASAAQTEGEPPCCADAREQLHVQRTAHGKLIGAASAAAEGEKARCLTELQGSYQEAIQKLVAGVEKSLAEARYGSGKRLQHALKRGTTLVAQRLNDRYMNAIQLIFEHVVDASGETAAQMLAEKAFASQGFKVNITEVLQQHNTQEKSRRQQQQIYSKSDVDTHGSMNNTNESTPIHHRNHNDAYNYKHRRGFGRHLLGEVAAANTINSSERGRGGTGGARTVNSSMMNTSTLLTPSPTPSPKASPNAATSHGNHANVNTPVAV